jgi:tripartite-type tricarboxylate transporter receptor subunit TctC
MKLSRRTLIAGAGVAAIFPDIPALAQPKPETAYPTRPIKWVIPNPPGGIADLVGRTAGEIMSRSLGQPIVLDNRPGAASTVAAALVAHSVPDGYTVMMSTEYALSTAALLRRDLPYDPKRDLLPLGVLARFPLALIVNAKLPVRNVRELVDYVKARPGRVNYASAGSGTAYHLAAELFKSQQALEMSHVPYQGGAAIYTSLVRRDTDMSFAALNTFLPHIATGQLRALAIASDQRAPVLPDVPTFAEEGFPDFKVALDLGMAVPASTPPEVVRRLSSAMALVWADEGYRKRLIPSGVEVPQPHTSQEYQQELAREGRRLQALIVKHKLSFD